MSVVEFASSGTVNRGPQPQLWTPLREAGDALADAWADSDGSRLQHMVEINAALSAPPESELDEKMTTLAREVNALDPSLKHLVVDTWTADNPSRGYPHTDHCVSGAHLPSGLWEYLIELIPGYRLSLSVDGPSTWMVNGVITAEKEQIISLPAVTLPPTESGEEPAIREVYTEIRRNLDMEAAIYTGAMGQLLEWRAGTALPDGRYELVAVPEGHLSQSAGDTIHMIPPGIQAGRTLLFAA